MGRLTLREALASHRLDTFVQEQQDCGAELITGSELERGLALLITQRRLHKESPVIERTRKTGLNRRDQRRIGVTPPIVSEMRRL